MLNIVVEPRLACPRRPCVTRPLKTECLAAAQSKGESHAISLALALVQAQEANRGKERLKRLDTLKKKRIAEEKEAEAKKEAKESAARLRLEKEERRRKGNSC